MIGIKNSSGKLFYGSSLKDRVPDRHVLGSISETVDFSFIRRSAEPCFVVLERR